MREVEQDLNGLLHHVKGFASFHVDNETDTASVMLEAWIVKSLFRWWVYPLSPPLSERYSVIDKEPVVLLSLVADAVAGIEKTCLGDCESKTWSHITEPVLAT